MGAYFFFLLLCYRVSGTWQWPCYCGFLASAISMLPRKLARGKGVTVHAKQLGSGMGLLPIIVIEVSNVCERNVIGIRCVGDKSFYQRKQSGVFKDCLSHKGSGRCKVTGGVRDPPRENFLERAGVLFLREGSLDRV